MNNAVVRNAYTVYIHENAQSLPSLSGPGLEDSEGLQNRERERKRGLQDEGGGGEYAACLQGEKRF